MQLLALFLFMILWFCHFSLPLVFTVPLPLNSCCFFKMAWFTPVFGLYFSSYFFKYLKFYVCCVGTCNDVFDLLSSVNFEFAFFLYIRKSISKHDLFGNREKLKPIVLILCFETARY